MIKFNSIVTSFTHLLNSKPTNVMISEIKWDYKQEPLFLDCFCARWVPLYTFRR